MQARKIPKNYRNVTGYITSSKSNRPISFESKLELFKNGIMIADTYPEEPSVALYSLHNIEVIKHEIMEKLSTKLKEKNDIQCYLDDISLAIAVVSNKVDDIESNVSYIEDEL